MAIFILLNLLAAVALAQVVLAQDVTPARILVNHLGYEPFGAKKALVQGSIADAIVACSVHAYPGGELVLRVPAKSGVKVEQWRDWRFWSVDFTALQKEGEYSLACVNGDRVLRSFPFRVQNNVLERHTLSNVVAHFKSQRVTGAFGRADARIPFQDEDREPIDASGGWYDASGDYGVHLSQLDFTSYFNNQQIPLVVYSLSRAYELLEARGDVHFNQIKRRLIDEATYGADFLVRMQRPGRSFYQTINAWGPGKLPEDRRIGPAMTSFGVKESPDDRSPEEQDGKYEVSYRSGGGFAIAGLAMAARLPLPGAFDQARYLATAESAFAFLEAHNSELLNDGVENMVDDYTALVAATELLRTTGKEVYADAAKHRADRLLARLAKDERYSDYWRVDAKDRPFFHPSDAGAPVVSLIAYHEFADAATQRRIKDVVARSLRFELGITAEVDNPFGLARQYVQNTGGERRGAFFFPHDTEAAPWWQGENARLASLATAARLAAPLFADDQQFQFALRRYAADQLNWILGLNPFDASMLHGTGRNNPEYGFFGSWQYSNYPGGIVNGVTAGFKDGTGIDFNLSYQETGVDADWRWGEQWLPHSAWYLLAIAAGKVPIAEAQKQKQKVVIGYIFVMDKLIEPEQVPAEKLTHINYAFANIENGRVVEGFAQDKENYALLNGLKTRNPDLKILVSVGGWTWSGGFSDMALTRAARKRFIDSSVDFLRRHQLDGLDIDWEFPGQVGMDNPHRPEDRENFTALLTEARAALDRAGQADGKYYLLTIASQASDQWLIHTEMDKVAAVLDYVNLMAYDQFVGFEGVAAHHAPLYTHPSNPLQLSAATVIDLYVEAGVPLEKIVLGVPFYGRAWGDVGAGERGLYQPGGPTQERLGTFYGNLSANLVNKEGFVRYWDSISEMPFLYNDVRRIFIAYDDPQSIEIKSRYVVERGLGGVMFWELSGDPQQALIDAITRGFEAAGQ